MEDQTQAILDDEAEEQAEQENPLGYVRVLSQKDLEQTDYPIQEGVSRWCVCVCEILWCTAAGEVTLGRGSECELVIEARSLSRKHATVLVEGGTHFIQDLNSRNKTYRGTVSVLKPSLLVDLLTTLYMVDLQSVSAIKPLFSQTFSICIHHRYNFDQTPSMS